MREIKSALRKRYLAERADIPAGEREEMTRRIHDNLLAWNEMADAGGILLYVSRKSEIDTTAIIDRLLSAGKRIAVPKTYPGGVMEFREISSRDELEKGNFETLEPSMKCKLANPDEYSVCIVPGAVFDPLGYRIGYGGGYYDRFLAGYHGVTGAIVFDRFVVDSLPTEEFDVPVGWIVSESGIHRCKA